MGGAAKAGVLAAAVAGSAAGLVAAAGSASAAATRPVVNSVSAGYAAGNIFGPAKLRTSSTWRFRYASATTRLPNPSTALNSKGDTLQRIDAVTGFAVHLATTKQTIVLGASWGGSAWNVNVAQEYTDHTLGANCNAGTAGTPNCSTGAGFANSNQFAPGATVRLDLFYDQNQGSIQWTVYQNGAKQAAGEFGAWTTKSSGGGPFTEAFAGADFSTDAYTSGLADFHRPMADAKLFAVEGTHFTSYNGTRGTVIGPWKYTQLELGTSSSNIDVNSPVLWNGGQNFGAWARS